jgi:hypothetical protein
VRLVALFVLGTVLLGTGCSSVGSMAVRTGAVREAPYTGPVAVFAGGLQPVGQDLGVVEVHGSNQEGDIEGLVPLFLQRVGQLGGDAAVLDDVHAEFHIVTTTMVETYTYPCGYHSVCTGTRYFPVSAEVMRVVARGRAVKMAKAPAGSAP